jgi:hypothetical protein
MYVNNVNMMYDIIYILSKKLYVLTLLDIIKKLFLMSILPSLNINIHRKSFFILNFAYKMILNKKLST